MKKLFILGAGSNIDFGFPTGIALSQAIESFWQQDDSAEPFLAILAKNGKRLSNDFEDVRENARKISARDPTPKN